MSAKDACNEGKPTAGPAARNGGHGLVFVKICNGVSACWRSQRKPGKWQGCNY
jgi:hypothetical protein